MFQRLFTLALTTFRETMRQPIYGVMVLMVTALLVLNVSLAAFTLEDDNKLLLDLGLSTLLLGGLFLAGFSATGIMGKEIESKTVLTVVSKPVSRPLFIAGKFVGLVGALAVAYYINFLVFVLAIRHGVMQNTSDPWDMPVLVLGGGAALLSVLLAAFANYFYDKHFATTAISLAVLLLTAATLVVPKFDKHFAPIASGTDFVGGQVIIAAYLVFLVVLIAAAVALAASTRLGTVMTLVTCTLVVAVGVMSDYLFGARTSALGQLAYRVIPNVGPFWIIDGLTSGSGETSATGAYVGYLTLYALLMTVAILNVAVIIFQRREVG